MTARRLPNGNLLVPRRAESEDGSVVGDGVEEITPEHPDYRRWASDARGEPTRDPDPNEVGTVVDPVDLAAMDRLARGLHPCIVEVDPEGRGELDKWGRLVRRSDEPEQPPS